MPTEDVAYQQRVKIRRMTLGFGVIQVVLGLALTGLSFTAFVLSESEKIRNACPYWAGFTVFCSGTVGIVAWRYTTVLSMGLFTFFSAVCVVLHMIGTILTGEVGGLLKSIIMCQHSIIDNYACECCDSIMTCKQNVPTLEFEGVEKCSIITGLMKELMYGLCVLNIFGSLVCFIATILGCTSVARQAGQDQSLFRRRLSARSDSHEQSQYSWLHNPTDLTILPPYAPPMYRSVDNVQDCGATPYIVPPPVYDPTDLPPPYSSRNASLTSSGFSLNIPDAPPPRDGPRDGDDSAGGGSAIVLSEGRTIIHHQYENHYQQRVYSENRARPSNSLQITSVMLTRNGILERCSGETRAPRSAIQSITSLNNSRTSLQSEATISRDRIERQILQSCEKAEECKESLEEKLTYKQPSRTRCRLSNVEQSSELIMFDESRNKRKTKELKRQNGASKSLNRKLKSSKVTEDEFSTSDSGLGDELALLCEPTDSIVESNAKTIKSAEDEVRNDSKDTFFGNANGADTSRKSQSETELFLTHDVISLDDKTAENYCTVKETVEGDTDQTIGESQRLRIDSIEKGNYDDHGKQDLNTGASTNAPTESKQLDISISGSDSQGVSNEPMRDFDQKSDALRSRSRWEETSGDAGSQEESDSTDDMIRLMDDFFTNKTVRTRNEEDKTVYSVKNFAQPVYEVEESSNVQRESTGERRKISLSARSDTCMATPRVSSPREMSTISDPGVSELGTFQFPGFHRPFRNGSSFVPPNMELPMEIREESFGNGFNVIDSKRRKRLSGRDVPQPKRRALGKQEELTRTKSRCQHKSPRKDDTSRQRQKLLKSQNARVREEISRNYWQTYHGRSSVRKTKDELLRNPSAWMSLKKAKSAQSNIGKHAKQLAADDGCAVTSNDC